MPPDRPKRGKAFTVVLFLSGTIVCCALVLGVLYIGLPNTLDIIGEPASILDPFDRIFLTTYLWLNLESLDSAAGDETFQYELEVVQGENATSVIGRLKTAGIVEDEALLRNFLQYRGLDRGIEAGSYIMDGGMTIREIATALQNADPEAISIVILEGWRREQIAEAIDVGGLSFTSAEFLSSTQRPPNDFVHSDQIPVFATLEGFLFPDTYSVSPEMSAEEFVNRMLDNFVDRLTPNIISGIEQQGLNIYQAVSLAAIVEREAVVPQERDLIASVFLNRFEIGMLLEADPTVQYALGIQPEGSWWKAPLSFDDLGIDSPYNTYRYPGLPPGPITNPGLESIRAVAFPAESEYLYFRAMCDGSGMHSFATTFEDHRQNACN
jgi:UPF0755 protein